MAIDALDLDPAPVRTGCGNSHGPVAPAHTLESARALPDVARELGIDFEALLQEAGLEWSGNSDPGNRMNHWQLESLYRAFERRSGCDWVGLQVGRRSTFASTDPGVRWALCARTAGDGLRQFVEQFNLHDATATIRLLGDTDNLRLVYTICEHGLVESRHVELSGMAVLCTVLQQLFGEDWRPRLVRLTGRQPADMRELQEFFAAPLEFEATEPEIEVERQWLEQSLPAVDEPARLAHADAIRQRRASMLAELPATLQRILRKRLRIESFSMDDVAAQLSMHRRTLDRRLQRHGTTYGALLEQVREEIARQLLRDTQLPIRCIAQSVRFSSAANFATSFRRRVGMTPTEYRRQGG